ncbi:hypothetical protein CTA1_6232 [Colletotrichum tanaceti]|uniref:Uncharacterized protein n=1 Tax=Colletotrichum tanaceti TaxID=1306861 RepID=A0A4U6XKS6_9PEZI|nr:hypothetical protein CTA1_6232 [Colletotrichum tanaceti]
MLLLQHEHGPGRELITSRRNTPEESSPATRRNRANTPFNSTAHSLLDELTARSREGGRRSIHPSVYLFIHPFILRPHPKPHDARATVAQWVLPLALRAEPCSGHHLRGSLRPDDALPRVEDCEDQDVVLHRLLHRRSFGNHRIRRTGGGAREDGGDRAVRDAERHDPGGAGALRGVGVHDAGAHHPQRGRRAAVGDPGRLADAHLRDERRLLVPRAGERRGAHGPRRQPGHGAEPHRGGARDPDRAVRRLLGDGRPVPRADGQAPDRGVGRRTVAVAVGPLDAVRGQRPHHGAVHLPAGRVRPGRRQLPAAERVDAVRVRRDAHVLRHGRVRVPVPGGIPDPEGRVAAVDIGCGELRHDGGNERSVQGQVDAVKQLGDGRMGGS